MSAIWASASELALHPFFLDADTGPLYAVHHHPANPAAWRGNVLCVPAFNEEMNRCRSMITLQAAALARLGFGTLVIDLHGTGDSAGHYRDGRWSIWLDNLRAAHRWLGQQRGGCAALLGVRLGALLATELHAALGEPAVALLLWQPVVDGKIHMNQFMRLRIAAQLDRPNLPKETTASMRAALQADGTLEVSGYEVHRDLVAAIDSAHLSSCMPAAGAAVLWLEHVTAGAPEIPLPSRKVAQAWSEAGRPVTMQTYPGAQFWQVHERVVTPSIIEQTSAWLAARGSANVHG
jgi:exosortase A-associated hydrolase 2